MRKSLISCLSLLTLIGTANAAEMPFSGFYIGVNVGETAWDTVWVDRDNWVDDFGTDFAIGSVANRFDDTNWGVDVGFNWRCGNSVLGVEVDWSSINNSNAKSYFPSDTNIAVLNLQHENDWYGSIRGRAGVVADNLLLYVTGGVSYARFNHNWTMLSTDEIPESSSTNDTKWGGVGGVGAELALSCNVSIKAEGLYFTYPEDTFYFFSTASEHTVHFDILNSFWVGRIGLNFTFL